MKFNKKIVVTTLSTVMGLSIVGAISGTVAWYQYSTRATTSFVATSVANTGVLQISKTGNDATWVRDLGNSDTGSADNKLTPVTFGGIDKDDALPAKAYFRPESGYGAYSDWTEATAGKEYIQYSFYLRAVKVDSSSSDTLVAKDVYLSDITMQALGTNTIVDSSMRLHIAIDGGSNILISKTAVTDLATYGKLDLDGDGKADKVHGYQGISATGECVYGVENSVQNTYGISDWKATRDGDGFAAADAGKKLFTTKTTGATKVTVTIWLEGWAQLHPQADPSEVKAMWDPTKTVGVSINFGLTFDVGKGAFDA